MTGMVTVHQGPGLTNAMTGIAEAAKSRTPLLVLAAEAPGPTRTGPTPPRLAGGR
jgi:thiamine pyrophosphate-dependent acetolactate synthase large subunit-like protein